LLVTIREAFPKARIIYKDGNHEMRWESYLSFKAPELLGIEDFMLDKVLGWQSAGLNTSPISDRFDLASLTSFTVTNTVSPSQIQSNAARGLFLRAKAYAMCGHFHQKRRAQRE